MESFWLSEVKLWLLDHAVKHDMYNVVKHILKDKSTVEHLYGKFDGSNATEEIQPTYLFLLLLEHLKESLQNFEPPDSSHHFSWDEEALNLIIDILNATYKQKPFVDLHTFMKLMKLLKLLVIFRMLCESSDGHAVCGALNLLFPHWNGEKSKEKLEQMYGSESLAYADDMKQTNSETRKFILKLVLNGRCKTQYLRSHYGTDVKKMVKKCLPLLNAVVSSVKNLIGPSTIEQSLAYTNDMKQTNSETWTFILKLVLNGRYKTWYLRSHYRTDVKKMVKCLPLLDAVVSAMKNLIGPSTVDQIISCTDEDLSSSNDPAVQIILEYLKPDMTADDYLELLKVLEFPESQEEAMSISFGSPLEDIPVLKIDDSDAEGENELRFNMIDNDTPPSTNNNLHLAQSSEHQHYGPLGPSSVTKMSVEETSEIRTAQEHMELMDSEEEEHS